VSSLATYARGVLAYNLGVIAWGAYVRATRSGAGCGAHWPLCNGEVIPSSPTAEMLVEFSHRVTSGLALVSVVVLAIWVWRACAKGHPARRGAGWALVFMLAEAAVGAGLVLFELVADNETMARALIMAVLFGASADFATPIGYQTNMIVMGPGGYTFRDYLRLGLPLHLALWVVVTVLLPLFWPLRPAP